MSLQRIFILLLLPLLMMGFLSRSARLARKLLAPPPTPIAASPGDPPLSTRQYAGLSQAESLYLNQVHQWDEMTTKALGSTPHLETPERAVQLMAKMQTVELRRSGLIPPPSFAAADALMGRGISKMKDGAIKVMQSGPTHNSEVQEGAKIYTQGIHEADATAARLQKLAQSAQAG